MRGTFTEALEITPPTREPTLQNALTQKVVTLEGLPLSLVSEEWEHAGDRTRSEMTASFFGGVWGAKTTRNRSVTLCSSRVLQARRVTGHSAPWGGVDNAPVTSAHPSGARKPIFGLTAYLVGMSPSLLAHLKAYLSGLVVLTLNSRPAFHSFDIRSVAELGALPSMACN